MLTDPVEIEIISRARQKNVRDPGRSRVHFERIFADFLHGTKLHGQKLVDLGPGQYDFGVIARERGADCWGIDNDPAVIELGRYKKFRVEEGRIHDVSAQRYGQDFDGLFCKFAVNAFWYWNDPEAHADFVGRLFSLLKPSGWLWIAPWNGPPKERIGQPGIRETLALQTELFRSRGCEAFDLGDGGARHYGVHGKVANNVLFVRGLKPTKKFNIIGAAAC